MKEIKEEKKEKRKKREDEMRLAANKLDNFGGQ